MASVRAAAVNTSPQRQRNHEAHPFATPGALGIVKLLKSQKIAKKAAMYATFKLVYHNKTVISAFMTGMLVGSTAFSTTLRSTGGYTAEFLGETIFDICGAT